MDKEKLRLAYEAGEKSVALNLDRDKRLEGGTKQIEEEYNFENWYANQQINDDLKSNFNFDTVLRGVINGTNKGVV